MSTHTIVVTAQDRRRLKILLVSEFAQAIEPKSQLTDLQAELERAVVVESEQVPRDVVTMNSTVRLQNLDTGDFETYTLVYPDLADIAGGKLSILAPIGTAILGCRVDDVVQCHVPSRVRRLRVDKVLYQPEWTGTFDPYCSCIRGKSRNADYVSP